MSKKLILFFLMGCLLGAPFTGFTQSKMYPAPLQLGYSIQITTISPEKMKYAKSVGIDCIEIGMGGIVDKKTLMFQLNDQELTDLFNKAKKAADDAGIEIWSIHMPYSQFIDISLSNETNRQKVVAVHNKILKYCGILQPKIILFHPSWFLGLNERELRKSQMIKSANELNKTVKSMKATMVIENMLGPQLLLPNGKRERPLCRSVEETVEIMNRLPEDIYSAIDVNHIKNPEKLILAMGSRLKTVHISDGNGEEECHYFPCSGQGKNDWTAILSAFTKVHYKGPFMYECHYNDVKDMKPCYHSLYATFIKDVYGVDIR